MKRFVAAIVAAMLALSLVACTRVPEARALSIGKAELTQQEQDIVELVGGDANARIYDFTLDNNVKSLQINTYKLVNGSWEVVSGGSRRFTDVKGRLALGFDKLCDGLRTSLQSNKHSGSESHTADNTEDFTGMGTLTTALDQPTEIVYEQEIPLVLQISTAADKVVSGDLDSFFTPDELVRQGYEHVYAITIRFSQETVSELAE